MATDAGKVGPHVCARCRDWKRIGDSAVGLCGNPKIRFDDTAETSSCEHFSDRDTARPMCPWPDCQYNENPQYPLNHQTPYGAKWHHHCVSEAAAEALAAREANIKPKPVTARGSFISPRTGKTVEFSLTLADGGS